MYKIRKEVELACSHTIPNHVKCGKPHGHTYRVIVHASCRESELKDGMVMDFGLIKKQYDHDNLNRFMDIPTAENFAKEIFDMVPHCDLVEVWETKSNYASYSKEIFN